MSDFVRLLLKVEYFEWNLLEDCVLTIVYIYIACQLEECSCCDNIVNGKARYLPFHAISPFSMYICIYIVSKSS